LRKLPPVSRGIAVAVIRTVVLAGDEQATTVDLDATRPRARRPASPPGQRYELGEALGRGGGHEMFAAYDTQIGRDVVIKRMRSNDPLPARLSEFLHEARVQGRLQHPAIPAVFELGTDAEGRAFFVTAKLAGVTLAEVVRDPDAHATFTRPRLLRAFVEVCRALELAHARDIIHRDLKPSNILLGDHDDVFVLDWSSARELEITDRPTGTLTGSPAYTAPEQARGDRDIDARADVYSLGCVLYEILTGAQLHPHRPPSRPPRDDMPPELELVYQRATVRERMRRTPTVRELADAVQQFLDGDRDLAHRRELARAHLERAQGALASAGLDEVRRRTAMREAGRALALDPTLDSAAELVGRVMFEPPAEMPAEVVEELAAQDIAEGRRQLRVIARVSAFNALWVPLLLLLGVRDAGYLIVFAIVMLANLGGQLYAEKHPRWLHLGWPLAAATGIAMILVLARMWSPILVAPPFIVMCIMGLGLSSFGRDRRMMTYVGAVAIVTLMAAWGAEALGLVTRTISIEHGDLVLHSPMRGSDDLPFLPMLVFYAASLISSAAWISWSLSRLRHRARERLQLQSWHLRQLVH
jgi:serine/threonine-protein kinase